MIYLILILGAISAGVVTSIAGGGGIFVITFLTVLEVPIKVAIGTNRVSALLDNATSSYTYYKKGKIHVEFLKYAIIPALIGPIIGSELLCLLNGKILERLMPFILMILVINLVTNKNKGLENKFEGFTKQNLLKGAVITFFLGIYMGFFGLAIGNFFTLFLVYIFKFDFLEAVANAKPIIFLMGFVSLIFYIINGLVNYKYALIITVFRII